MSNLDQLTARILEEAKAKADQILSEAEKTAAAKIDEKKNAAEDLRKKALRKASDESELFKTRLHSNAELRIRNDKLQAKQEVIEKVLNLTKDKLRQLDDKSYLAYMSSRLKGSGIKDHQVLMVQKGREAAVKEHFPGAAISDKAFAPSGFIVEDKGIQENYTFDTYIDYMRDDLEAQLADILFGRK